MAEMKIPIDLDNRISNAVDFFWTTRTGQKSKQDNSAVHDQGNRGAVTGGKQLDGFVDLISEILPTWNFQASIVPTKNGICLLLIITNWLSPLNSKVRSDHLLVIISIIAQKKLWEVH